METFSMYHRYAIAGAKLMLKIDEAAVPRALLLVLDKIEAQPN